MRRVGVVGLVLGLVGAAGVLVGALALNWFSADVAPRRYVDYLPSSAPGRITVPRLADVRPLGTWTHAWYAWIVWVVLAVVIALVVLAVVPNRFRRYARWLGVLAGLLAAASVLVVAHHTETSTSASIHFGAGPWVTFAGFVVLAGAALAARAPVRSI